MQNTRASLSRRDFLRTSGQVIGAAAAVALASPGIAQAQERKIGYAIVGLGRLTLGQVLPAFAQCQHSRPAALISGDRDKALKTAQQYNIDPASIYDYDNYDRLADNPDVDAVFNALPNSMHAEYTIRAARAGKHVLCEKPMANTVEECQQMIDVCKQAGRKLMVAYRLRYEPHTQAAIDLCRGGQYGKIKMIQSIHSFNIAPNQWRLDKQLAGGGPLMDIGIYCLNAARYLTGEEPVSVSAEWTQPDDDPRFREVEEAVAFTLRFPSGALASCSTSYAHPYASRCHVYLEGVNLDMETAFAYRGISLRLYGRRDVPALEFPQVNHFAAEMDHLARCILDDAEPLTPGEDGLADVRIMQAIYQAAETGRAVRL